MSEKTNCGRIRDWIVDAAAGSLAKRRRVEFDAHVSRCAGCREEFQRVEMLLQAIDQGVHAIAAAAPRPELLVNVRQRIAAQEQSALRWWRRYAWLTAAGACAALAIVVFAAVALHRPARDYAHRPIAAMSKPNLAVVPSKQSAGVESPKAAPLRKPALVVARRKASRRMRRQAKEPEILVEPGQMQALMQFVADVQKGKIDGAKIMNEIKASQKPIEIKPLTITPLDTSAGDKTEEPAASVKDQNFANARSN